MFVFASISNHVVYRIFLNLSILGDQVMQFFTVLPNTMALIP